MRQYEHYGNKTHVQSDHFQRSGQYENDGNKTHVQSDHFQRSGQYENDETRHTYSRTISSVVNGTIRSQILMTDFFSKANDTACVAHFTAHSMSLLIFTWDDSRVLACIKLLPFFLVPVGSPSRGGDVMVYV